MVWLVECTGREGWMGREEKVLCCRLGRLPCTALRMRLLKAFGSISEIYNLLSKQRLTLSVFIGWSIPGSLSLYVFLSVS